MSCSASVLVNIGKIFCFDCLSLWCYATP